jgi:hypothetical protein
MFLTDHLDSKRAEYNKSPAGQLDSKMADDSESLCCLCESFGNGLPPDPE